MHHFKSLLIFRPLNLLILAVNQVLVYYCLAPGRHLSDIFDPVLIKLVIAGVLVTAAGNVHNDLLDVATDKENKPGKNYSVYWPSRTWLWLVYSILTGTSLLLTSLLSLRLGLIFLTIHFLLFTYNVALQRMPLIGNLVIAIIVGFSIVIMGLVFPDIENGPLFYYGSFAFLVALIREIVKDAQDMAGDSVSGYNTLPVLIGKRRTNRIIANLSVFTVVMMTSLAYNNMGVYFTGTYRIMVLTYGILCIILPLAYVVYRTAGSSDAAYGELSALLKYIMITGLASMLFF